MNHTSPECNGVSCRSDLGNRSCSVASRQLCGVPSSGKCNNIAGFRTVHLLITMCGYVSSVAVYDRWLADDNR